MQSDVLPSPISMYFFLIFPSLFSTSLSSNQFSSSNLSLFLSVFLYLSFSSHKRTSSLSVQYRFASGLAQGWKMGGSRSGRTHLHDMNIMERAGSLGNLDYENATCWTESSNPRWPTRYIRPVWTKRSTLIFEIISESSVRLYSSSPTSINSRYYFTH